MLLWNFAVLSAAQLTIRLIMAYSLRLTILAAVAMTAATLLIAGIYDAAVMGQTSLSLRLAWAPLPMALMGLAGFAVARWILRIKRLRGQIIAALMIGLLDPHLFTLLS